MIDNPTVLWYNTDIKRWFSVQYRLGTAHQNQKALHLHNVIKLRKEPSSEMDLALFLQKS